MVMGMVYGALLGVLHFFNDELDKYVHPFKDRVVSFGAGVSIAYLFLFLFPELFRIMDGSGVAFFMVLLGFTLFHIAEKHVYQHKSWRKRLKELKEFHSIAFFFYHFLIGVTIFYFAAAGLIVGLIFFIPILLHTAVSNISFSEIHPHIKENLSWRIILASPSLAGVIFASYVVIPIQLFTSILGLVIGILLYVVVRDSIPKNKEGNIVYFVLGTSIMVALVVVI